MNGFLKGTLTSVGILAGSSLATYGVITVAKNTLGVSQNSAPPAAPSVVPQTTQPQTRPPAAATHQSQLSETFRVTARLQMYTYPDLAMTGKFVEPGSCINANLAVEKKPGYVRAWITQQGAVYDVYVKEQTLMGSGTYDWAAGCKAKVVTATPSPAP